MSPADCHGGETHQLRVHAAECIERPSVSAFVVAKDIEITVIRSDLKAPVTRAVPLVHDLLHLKRGSAPSTRPESDGTFIRLIPGITFNLELQGQGVRPFC